MRLTVFSDYALRILLVLASRAEDLVTIAELSKAFQISEAHLVKVAHALGKTGWVKTVRGRHGGLRLAINPGQLTLGEIVRCTEPDFALVDCLGTSKHCVLEGACGLARAMHHARAAFLTELDRYSLAELVDASPGLGNLALPQALTWQGKSPIERLAQAE